MKKKNHFQPVFYLRRFAALEPRERLWTYDIQTGDVRSSTAESTAHENYLYTVRQDDGSRLQDVEDWFADVEGKAAPILDRLIAGETIEGQERADFASFMAIAHVRTDVFRLQYAQIAMGMAQIKLYATARHDGAFKGFIKGVQQHSGPMTEDEIELAREGMLNPADFTVSVDKQWTLRAIKAHDTIAPLFYEMNWTILRAGPTHYFITSDNPLIYDVPAKYRDHDFTVGLSHRRVEVTFPLSSKACLLATWQKDIPESQKIPDYAIRGLNRQRAGLASRFLYGPKEDKEIAGLAAEFKDSLAGVRMSGFGPEEYSPVSLRRSKKS